MANNLHLHTRRSAQLADRFAGGHGRRKREVEAAGAGAHGDRQPSVRGFVDMIRYAGRFSPEEQDVASREGEIGIGHGRLGGKQDQSAAVPGSPGLERLPGDMTFQRRHLQIVHAGALQRPVGHVEACRLNDVDGQVEARRHAQDRTRIARNVRLVERYAQVVRGRGRQYGDLLKSDRKATVGTVWLRYVSFQLARHGKEVYRAAIVNSNRRGVKWIA